MKKKLRTREKEEIHSTRENLSDNEEVKFAASTYAQVEYSAMIPYRTTGKSPKSKQHDEILSKRESDHEDVEIAASNYAHVEYAAMIPYRTAGKSSKAKSNEETISRRESPNDTEEVELATSNYAQVEYEAMIPYRAAGTNFKIRNEDEFSTIDYDMINPYTEMHRYQAPPGKRSQPKKGHEIYAQVEQDDLSAYSSTESVRGNDEYAQVDRRMKQGKVSNAFVLTQALFLSRVVVVIIIIILQLYEF